jgi:hypothetical protein
MAGRGSGTAGTRNQRDSGHASGGSYLDTPAQAHWYSLPSAPKGFLTQHRTLNWSRHRSSGRTFYPTDLTFLTDNHDRVTEALNWRWQPDRHETDDFEWLLPA